MEIRLGRLVLWCSIIGAGSHGTWHIDWLSLFFTRAALGWKVELLLLNVCLDVEWRHDPERLVELAEDGDAGRNVVLIQRRAVGPFDVELARTTFGWREHYCRLIQIQGGGIPGSGGLTLEVCNFVADIGIAWRADRRVGLVEREGEKAAAPGEPASIDAEKFEASCEELARRIDHERLEHARRIAAILRDEQ